MENRTTCKKKYIIYLINNLVNFIIKKSSFNILESNKKKQIDYILNPLTTDPSTSTPYPPQEKNTATKKKIKKNFLKE